jgi:hypothetical protein
VLLGLICCENSNTALDDDTRFIAEIDCQEIYARVPYVASVQTVVVYGNGSAVWPDSIQQYHQDRRFSGELSHHTSSGRMATAGENGVPRYQSSFCMLSVAGIRQYPVKVSSSSCFACCSSLLTSKPLNRAHSYNQACSNDAGEHRQKHAKEHGGVCDCYEKVPRSRDEISCGWRFNSEVQEFEMDGIDLICKACIRAWFRRVVLRTTGIHLEALWRAGDSGKMQRRWTCCKALCPLWRRNAMLVVTV